MTVLERIQQVMGGLFGLDPKSIGDDASMTTIDAWDSLMHVSLVMAVEQEFNVRFRVEDAFAMTSLARIRTELAKMGLE
jgi:acyl carrier protein